MRVQAQGVVLLSRKSIVNTSPLSRKAQSFPSQSRAQHKLPTSLGAFFKLSRFDSPE